MRILTIIGSPRKKGNSYRAAKKLEDALKALGDHEFEYLFLADARLEACTGCFNCIARGIELCPFKDDRETIQEKMEKADGLVLVSPVYVMNVTALMKNFIDRVAYLCHRPAYHGKPALVMCTTAGIGMKETLDYMEKIADAWGYDVAARCGQITSPWPPSEAMEKKNIGRLKKSALRFDKSLRSGGAGKRGGARVGFKKYMGFRIFQNISRDVKEHMPADFQFYLEKEYYRPARIGFITRMAAAIMLKVVFFMMRDMGPGKDKNA
jgi:multimeric flavodoxin WrbA